ncbi:hypothetical protein N7470_008448 [Penicillium chermesinum]|nr:hypothetical protein N7470_008448 [Penicillium chermesinum]
MYKLTPIMHPLPKQGGADERVSIESVIINIDDSSTESLAANLDQLADDLIWDGQSSSTDFLMRDPILAVPKSTKAVTPTMTPAPVVDTTPDFFGLQGWDTDPSELLAALTAPKVSPLADAGFLTRLLIDDPIAQRHAAYLIQILRPFPQMMARKASFPPFIHQNWHHGDGPKAQKTLPEPIGNCMRIAQMFASRTPDTRDFVWSAIRTEQRRLMVQYVVFSPLTVASYRVLRALLIEMQKPKRLSAVASAHFAKAHLVFQNKHTPAGAGRTGYSPNLGAVNIRVACIWFLIGQVVVTKTGIPCDTSEEYHCLSLQGGRSLWESRTNQGWEAEYSATQTTIRGRQLTYFGDLMEAQKANSDPSMIQKMDSWNAEADTLGFMLTLATAMV